MKLPKCLRRIKKLKTRKRKELCAAYTVVVGVFFEWENHLILMNFEGDTFELCENLSFNMGMGFERVTI